MKKWWMVAATSLLLLTACGDKESFGDKTESEVIVDSEKETKQAEHLLDELQLKIADLYLPVFTDSTYQMGYINVDLNEDKQLSGSVHLEKKDTQMVYVQFGGLEIVQPEYAAAAKNLKDRAILEVMDGIVTAINGTYYEITDFNSNVEQLTKIVDALDKDSIYLQYLEIDAKKYKWPAYLPYGEPSKVAVSYDPSKASEEFNTANQSVGYFNDTIVMWQYNAEKDSLELPSSKLFLFTDKIKAYYDEEMDMSYSMTVNVNGRHAFVLNPISQVGGTQASVYYEKPENWETELEKAFKEIVKQYDGDVNLIQNGTANTAPDNSASLETTSEANDDENLAESDLSVVDRKFYIFGITLGMSQDDVIKMHGSPTEVYNDESGFTDVIAKYEDKSIQIGYIMNQQGELIVGDVSSYMKGSRYHYLINSSLNHDPVRDEYSTETSYFYDKSTNQVVKLIWENNLDKYSILLMPADPNFYAMYGL